MIVWGLDSYRPGVDLRYGPFRLNIGAHKVKILGTGMQSSYCLDGIAPFCDATGVIVIFDLLFELSLRSIGWRYSV